MLLLLSAFWLAASAAGPAPAEAQYARISDATYGAAIDESRQALEKRMHEFPGLSVAVGIDGRMVWAEGFGWADIEQRVPMRAASRLRVGSVAKPMTAALLALLVEDGLVDLDVPVQEYVPGFPRKGHDITTRLLAGHLAGIRHYRGDEFLSSRYFSTVEEGLRIFADDPLLSEPGTAYSYSSYGWNLISAVIEGATGRDFLELMDERVFGPLGMIRTVPDLNHLIVPDRARPYARREESAPLSNAPYVDNSYKWAGGGFLSTAEELVRFGMAHLEAGFLKRETLELLFTSQTTKDGQETGYGVGWGVDTDEKGRRVLGHGGGSVGGTTRLSLYPDQGLVIAAITNMSDGPDFELHAIVERFLASSPPGKTSPSR